MNRVVSLLLLWPALAPAQQIPELMKQLAEITGFEVKKPVVQHTMQRNELKSYFEKRIKEVTKPEEIRLEELALKKLGFVPQDFDLKKTTIELMTEQAAAFYDYRAKKMVLMADGGGMTEEMALVHELSHALADQHYNLEKFLKKAKESDDGSLARMAVMEGQATWIMSEFMARRMGQSLTQSDSLIDMMAGMAGGSGGSFPVFDQAPLYMRDSLIFPYVQGMRFQQRIVRALGKKGFAEVFERAPDSTREIFHPEIYLDRLRSKADLPADPPLPTFKNAKDWKRVTDGASGEFDHQVWIKQYAPSEKGLESEWRRAFYAIWEQKGTRHTALTYVSQWSSPEAARRFFAAYRKVLEGKWKKMTVTSETDKIIQGEGDEGEFTIRLTGDRVTSIEGLKPADPE